MYVYAYQVVDLTPRRNLERISLARLDLDGTDGGCDPEVDGSAEGRETLVVSLGLVVGQEVTVQHEPKLLPAQLQGNINNSFRFMGKEHLLTL